MQTATKPQHLDMLNGPIWNKLPRYALPVAATGILGQLFNGPTSPSSAISRAICARPPWLPSAPTARSSACC